MEVNALTYTIPEPLSNLYKSMEISPLVVLNNYAMAQIESKIQKYEAENSIFRKKHSLSYEEFKDKVEKNENVENFSFEDDLLDWQFVIENIIFWKKQLSQIKS